MAAPAFALAGAVALPCSGLIKSAPSLHFAAAVAGPASVPHRQPLSAGFSTTAALAAALLAAGQVAARNPSRARTARYARRPRVDPDAITAFDTEVAAQYSGIRNGVGSNKTASSTLGQGRVHLGGSVPEAHTAASRAEEPTEEEMARAVEQAAKDGIPNLLEMTGVARADLIEELTRKAFVLMEVGEIKEAMGLFGRATRIADAFQRLQAGYKDIQGKNTTKQTDEEFLGVRPEIDVLMKLRQELHPDDFVQVFGAGGKMAYFIGGW